MSTSDHPQHVGLRQRQPARAGRHPEASETRCIIAATDIFDLAGTKLWARNQPVSAELQRKLLDRKLREPLEACLVAEDGVTPASLAAALAQRVESDACPAPLLRPQASTLPREVTHLHLHPVWRSCCCRPRRRRGPRASTMRWRRWR